ncbi:PACE efflux transporter [Xenorhabdus szentirmaii]|uniref:Chlorhexidine efflux transporter domain-containing protein n=2 Tax=Xenorhabdus szentirmaii TaxID=290112 RepID=W1ISI6_9GAMM|nr:MULTISPECIES: PACE efflux transporter [Xenorhabdus]MBD2781385.1 PACE efflux transporter [Xenorhabdus sp. 38]MBD2791553.1 PACE efflux transporter [Xenorhabdus sp. CUL]MBD2800546.1 PACE efflux transporter [Xenorhabdus sp. M]MBD2821769.1 PACE efflux transporter [Xenorhabdus sp. 42]PHM32556.1 membrane protein [Xenorhabdus szentirmaii DSM 16338]
MQGIKRKIVFISSYEIIGMIMSSLGMAFLSGNSTDTTAPLALSITTIAVTWNFIFNSLFEYWEARQVSRVRTFRRRLAHAILFQLTLVVFLIPLISWWLSITLLEAFILDVIFIIYIPIYTFMFNWAFDKIFGLPASALPQEQQNNS